VVVRLASGHWVAGWASVAGLLSLLGGIQLLTLGVLGEYIGAAVHRESSAPTVWGPAAVATRHWRILTTRPDSSAEKRGGRTESGHGPIEDARRPSEPERAGQMRDPW